MQKQSANLVSKLFEIFNRSKGVSTDTRTLKNGQIFFALQGDNFDGNKFVTEAIEKGAIAVVCKHNTVDYHSVEVFGTGNPLGILQELATMYISQFNAPVLAITGSNGKTTNKELIAGILSEKYKVHSTPGNFNNNIGLPLTILSAPEDTQFFVLEMGTNHFGEIKDLCRIARPDYGIILNVGKSHLEYLKSTEGVLKAKSELADFLNTNTGRLFVNSEEKSIAKLHSHPVDKIPFSSTQLSGDIYMENVRKSPYLNFDIQDRRTQGGIHIKTSLLGDHNLKNLQNAMAVALYFGISIRQIKTAVERFEPGANRSKMTKWNNNTVVLDAYNANPTSMWASIEAFNSSFPNPKILILGDMGELGERAIEEHREIIYKIENTTAVDEVHLIGKTFQQVQPDNSKHIATYQDTKDFILKAKPRIEKKTANILIKGSRFLTLEKIID